MVEKVSKSEQKRLFKKVEELAAEIAELGDNERRKLPVEDEVRQAIEDCDGLKTGARKRQIKYLAKVLRQYPLDDVYSFLAARKGSALKKNLLFHRAERWRDVVINEAMELHDRSRRDQIAFEPDFSSDMINDLLEELPNIDEKDLRRCLYQYVRTHNKTHYRELFRMIKAATEECERQKTG